jgi:hypothetical protein
MSNSSSRTRARDSSSRGHHERPSVPQSGAHSSGQLGAPGRPSGLPLPPPSQAAAATTARRWAGAARGASIISRTPRFMGRRHLRWSHQFSRRVQRALAKQWPGLPVTPTLANENISQRRQHGPAKLQYALFTLCCRPLPRPSSFARLQFHSHRKPASIVRWHHLLDGLAKRSMVALPPPFQTLDGRQRERQCLKPN